MPVEFLTDEQAARYGRFVEVPSRAELDRLCFPDEADFMPRPDTVRGPDRSSSSTELRAPSGTTNKLSNAWACSALSSPDRFRICGH